MFKSKGKQQLYIGQNGQYVSLATHHGDWFRDNYQFVMDYTLLPHVNTIMGTKTVSFNFLLLLPTTESSERKGQYRFCHLFYFFIIFRALWHHWQHTVKGQYKKKNCLENTYLGRSWFEWLKNKINLWTALTSKLKFRPFSMDWSSFVQLCPIIFTSIVWHHTGQQLLNIFLDWQNE